MRVTAATLAAVVAASSAADREGTIPAAVLTYDGRRALSRLMIERVGTKEFPIAFRAMRRYVMFQALKGT